LHLELTGDKLFRMFAYSKLSSLRMANNWHDLTELDLTCVLSVKERYPAIDMTKQYTRLIPVEI
jgi:hypothetical protein